MIVYSQKRMDLHKMRQNMIKEQFTMLVLGRNCILLVFSLVGRLGSDAETCRSEGDVRVCQIHSDSNYQNNGESLETIAAELNAGENVSIDIKIPLLHLTKNISFNQLDSLTISGDPNSATVINCTHLDSDAGIMLVEVANITLENLMLTSCGSQMTIKTNTYSSALTIHSCGYVYVTNLVITKSQGIGLSILNHQEGTVYIAWSNFTDNKIPQEFHDILGGGGVYVGEFQQNSSSISFEFRHCLFERNVAHTRYYHSYYTDEFGETRTGYGQGGGAFLAFESDVIHSYMSVTFSYCIFTENQAFLGGGLSVKIGKGRTQLISTKVIVTIESSLFKSNGCINTTTATKIGGGTHLSYNLIKSLNGTGSEYNFWNVSFIKNCAEVGGGVHFFSYRNNFEHNSLLFNNCTFKRNRAHTGSAIDMIPSDFVKLSPGYTTLPVFRNCSFLENAVFVNSDSHNAQRIAGVGTLYASLYDVKFEEKNNFKNNKGTAVYMVNGVANFSDSSATFSNNRGIRGGAVALIGAATLIVGLKKVYVFVNNTALYQGGALFVQMINTHDFTVSRSCFIQYFDGNDVRVTKHWNNSITFSGNKAQVGEAIFATSLHPCQVINNNTKEAPYYITVDASEVFSIRGIKIDESKVATEGAQLEYRNETLYTIPGKQYSHGVAIIDDTKKTVSEPLRAKTIITGNARVMLDPAFSLYVREKIQLNGTPGDKANLLLQTVSTRQSYTLFEVVLKECPPGFKLENDVCICDSNKYFGLLECDTTDFYSYLTPGLWIGPISDKESNVTELVTSICPHSFCDYNQTTIRGIALPQSSSQLDKKLCGKTRTGVLCGRCRQGHTVHFHSPKFQCKSEDNNLCKVGWLFYILSELVPVTVVFITVLVFNISFTSGAVNGFILFSQVLISLNIDASGIITFPNQRTVTEGYQLMYGFLNLEFFTTESMSFCLWPNATALDMLAFKFITIVYALSLVILVVWFMNKCGGRCLGKWCRITAVKSSVIHGISAFLIICYSQSITVSHSLVNGGELWRKEGSNITIANRVWLNGNVVYFSAKHLPYALPALFFLLTIGVLPPLLLLAYPLSNRILAFLGFEESKLVKWISQKLPINSLKPLLDSFQGCFKDNLRFFAGLYFLYRWMAPVVFTISSSLGTAYITTEILLILMLAIHAFSQPYLQRVHNMVDTVLFTDLLLINSITCIHYFLFQSQENRYTVKKKVAKTAVVQAILIYLPFCAMVIYVLVLGYKHIYGFYYKRCGKQNKFNKEMDMPAMQTLGWLKTVVHSISSISGDTSNTDNELPHRLIAGQVSYECFEDTDRARETYVETKEIVTY